jgi:hypothetical protein
MGRGLRAADWGDRMSVALQSPFGVHDSSLTLMSLTIS